MGRNRLLCSAQPRTSYERSQLNIRPVESIDSSDERHRFVIDMVVLMYLHRFITIVLFLLLISICGCTTSHINPPPDVDRLTSSVELVKNRSNLPVTFAQLIDDPNIHSPDVHQAPLRGRNILVLSAGGRDGAYSAGVLAGWSPTGTRPSFDVVTGISTGALIAPLAFLGKQYDQRLKAQFTTVRTSDIYHRKALLTVLWSDSLADSEPLRRRIEEEVTDGLLAEIARKHLDGGRLYVGTTNLATGQLTVWDMGAIAAGSDPNKRKLFRSIILASCSIPGFFPAVPIEVELDGRRYSELHGDGGISSTMLLQPYMILDKNGDNSANVYAIVAGKLSTEPRQIDRRLVSELGASMQEMLESRTRDDLFRIFLLTRLSGGSFAFTSIPREVKIDPNTMQFDLGEMRRLFEAGHAQAANGWRSIPPGVNPEEWVRPRPGIQFRTPSERRGLSENATYDH